MVEGQFLYTEIGKAASANPDERVIDLDGIIQVLSALARKRSYPCTQLIKWRCAMPARRLVRLIEKNSEQLARELSEKVWNSPRCSDLRKVPADELQARTREIYQNLNNWLMDLTEAEVEQRYTELGARRAAQGVAYSHFLWAITATREHMTAFVQREGFSDTPMQLQGELELMHILGQFFDRALYYTAMGYERERTRIGSNLRRRRDDHQKVHA